MGKRKSSGLPVVGFRGAAGYRLSGLGGSQPCSISHANQNRVCLTIFQILSVSYKKKKNLENLLFSEGNPSTSRRVSSLFKGHAKHTGVSPSNKYDVFTPYNTTNLKQGNVFEVIENKNKKYLNWHKPWKINKLYVLLFVPVIV